MTQKTEQVRKEKKITKLSFQLEWVWIFLLNVRGGYRYYNNESSDTVRQNIMLAPCASLTQDWLSMCPETHDDPLLKHNKTTILFYILWWQTPQTQ